jgi:NAD-dependent dihydropyrimidine dehydrogenase PreA subunit
MNESQGKLWEGLDRKDLHWNPTIDEEKCKNCGTCIAFCKHGVYNLILGKTIVMQPFECVVLCNNCEKLCPNQAISFPNKVSFLKEIRILRTKKSL